MSIQMMSCYLRFEYVSSVDAFCHMGCRYVGLDDNTINIIIIIAVTAAITVITIIIII